MLRNKGQSKRIAAGCLFALGLAAWAISWPTPARAHVKWFAPFDLTVEPTPPALFIFQHAWLLGLALSVPALWLMVGMDQLDRRRGLPSNSGGCSSRAVVDADDIVRVAMGVWLTWLWALPTPVFLTPELVAPTATVQWLQLLLSVFCLSRRTAWITGMGLLALYAAAARHYGLFHLADYPLFVGIAAYLIGISTLRSRSPSLRRVAHHRHSILVIAMATTLCWASIEKWAYPSWTMPILTERTYLALGLEPATFMALAGWVEFGLAILLVIGGRFSSRLAALALFTMFAAAVLEFGKVDLVGHLPIIASLALVVTRGNGDVGKVAGFSRRTMPIRLVALPVAYFASLVTATTAYFGGWRLAYDDVPRLDWSSEFNVSLIVAGLMLVFSVLAMAFIALVSSGTGLSMSAAFRARWEARRERFRSLRIKSTNLSQDAEPDGGGRQLIGPVVTTGADN